MLGFLLRNTQHWVNTILASSPGQQPDVSKFGDVDWRTLHYSWHVLRHVHGSECHNLEAVSIDDYVLFRNTRQDKTQDTRQKDRTEDRFLSFLVSLSNRNLLHD